MIRFIQWPLALALALLLPAVAVVALIIGRRTRARRLAQLGTRAMLARLSPHMSRRGAWHMVRLIVALAFIGLAFAGPRWGLANAVTKRSGADVVLALDASLSMTAPDEKPSRLAKMKQTVRQLRALSPDDRFAVIAFAGRAYILTPLTTDDGALELYLDNLDPTVVGQGGSSIASALRQATTLLRIGKGEGDKAIVLMSDGEAFEPLADVVSEAKRAKDAGIALVTVGFGTTAGSTIPITENGRTTLKRDEQGATVITHYTPEFLRAAALAAAGNFIPAEATNKAERIRTVLDRLKTAEHAVSTGRDLSPRFQWFLAPALLLLLLDSLLSLRTKRRSRVTVAALAAAAVTACGSGQERQATEMYNRGTVLLARDSLAAAVPLLDSVAVHSEALRFPATFNSGWAYLVTGRRLHGDTAKIPLDSAQARYRRALVLAPDDRDAKWNYELTLRPQKKSGGGGGGGGRGGGGGGGAARNPQPKPSGAAGIGQQQAEAVLNNAAREEQDVQGRKQQKNVPQPPPRGKDW